jgi:hypothetical protein
MNEPLALIHNSGYDITAKTTFEIFLSLKEEVVGILARAVRHFFSPSGFDVANAAASAGQFTSVKPPSCSLAGSSFGV